MSNPIADSFAAPCNESAELVWITPNADRIIHHLARVSNPNAKPDDTPRNLIAYMLKHKHWSPFEMASMCLEVNTTRDIGRQLLRHVSFRFQEFSQRYADATQLPMAIPRQARAQDAKNRQNSIEGVLPVEVCEWWINEQVRLQIETQRVYREALQKGIAKEVARVVLMEGLTSTKMYLVGNIRSWMHFCQLRMDPDTQLETRRLARMCWKHLATHMPHSCKGLMTAIYQGMALSKEEQTKIEYVLHGMDPETFEHF